MRSVVGIDAAWTVGQPSGIAIISDDGRGWRLRAVSASYDAFLSSEGASPIARHRGSMPKASSLITTANRKVGAQVDLVAIDMPLSLSPIVARRSSDNMISAVYGARHASTHTPSAERPGRLSDELRTGFEIAGYPLAVSELNGLALIEVYPHPALIELAAADRRLPYKQSKISKYWPDISSADRRANLLQTWGRILELLDARIPGVLDALPLPPMDAQGHELKAFEDALDSIVCAWVGACAIDGRAIAYGDQDSAIWVPEAL
ncbi:DUF429 domain-containing protein [Sinorhizobium sp. 8-89]|uniref:DUF429 domain-containing protein n=1 Tax=Sinorhizobium sp. 7-81 TaxID=3049087 RepID=UPI0024C2400C|nr:DUF429 domain-containing protein [Sinorhizobium sp. 7-81]MDK1385137.1 DUF429 domain-containing protein [Sinorhizobium sp. 7-81]